MRKKTEKILLYPVTIELCEEGGYFASCLSLQGCHAEGETYAEAIGNIEDVIKKHIEVRRKHKEFISTIEVKGKKGINVNLPVLVRA